MTHVNFHFSITLIHLKSVLWSPSKKLSFLFHGMLQWTCASSSCGGRGVWFSPGNSFMVSSATAHFSAPYPIMVMCWPRKGKPALRHSKWDMCGLPVLSWGASLEMFQSLLNKPRKSRWHSLVFRKLVPPLFALKTILLLMCSKSSFLFFMAQTIN